ncbi:MAG: hypothetical protein WD360_00085 [Nitriliruptoraceae bacterium]
MKVRLVDPSHTPTSGLLEYNVRPENLAGKIVGLLGNAKPNSPVFLAMVGERLKEKYGVAEVVAFDKPVTSMPAPTGILEQMVQKVDIAVTGVGD